MRRVASLLVLMTSPALAADPFSNPQGVCDAFATIGRSGGLMKANRSGRPARWGGDAGEWGCTDTVYVAAFSGRPVLTAFRDRDASELGFMATSSGDARVERITLDLTIFRSAQRGMSVEAFQRTAYAYFENLGLQPPHGLDKALVRLASTPSARPKTDRHGLLVFDWKSERFDTPYGTVIARKSRGPKADALEVVIEPIMPREPQ